MESPETTPDGRDVLVLNEHGQRCGSFGDAANVWSLGSYSSAIAYFIEVDTVAPVVNETDNPEERPVPTPEQAGRMRLPVRSIGKIGGRFFFSTDLRFVLYPGADCVFPDSHKLELRTKRVGGGWRGALFLDGSSVIDCKTRLEEREVVEFLAEWCSRQEVGRFSFPDEIVAEMQRREREAEEAARRAADPHSWIDEVDGDEEAVGDSAMNAAFDTRPAGQDS